MVQIFNRIGQVDSDFLIQSEILSSLSIEPNVHLLILQDLVTLAGFVWLKGPGSNGLSTTYICLGGCKEVSK